MSTKLPTQMPGEVIMTDRPCIKCGYNLRGLQAGGACPECGTAITNAKKSVRYSDSLVDAPIGYIRLMAVGLGLQAGTILGITLLLILSRFHNNGVPLIHPLVQGVATLGAMVAWFAAAWIVTLRRPKTERVLADEILDNDLIRKLTRGSQSLALVATLVGWLGVATGFTLIKALAGLLMIGALFGLVPLGIYLSAFADWASETGEGARLRTATWCIAVCGTLEIVLLLVLKLNPPFALLLTFGVVMGGMVVVGGVLMFAFSVCMLAKASMWAIHNAVQAREREIRIANKRHRQAMRDAARAQAAAEALAADAPPPPESYRDDPSVIPFDEGDIPLAGDEPRVQRSAHEHHIDRKLDALRREGDPAGPPDADGGDGSEIYDLAPED
jgi:predicted RNA-binding Zn-ribbon protein involved in translation (DUF1610 family)